jgi:hypothetical protein
MRILRSITALAALTALASGCRDKQPELPQLSEAMPNLPLPPLATVVSRAGSEDALQITFRSMLAPDSMAVYYRRILSSGAWSLVGDTRTADGAIALYAERDGPPLWVTIRKDTLSSGTLLSLGGAVLRVDSTRAPVDSTPVTRDTTPPS